MAARKAAEKEQAMSKDPKAGRQLRKVERLDREWRQSGKQEGRTENALAHELGKAYRAGNGEKARRMQGR